jgi:hypothetical protein
VDQLEARPRSDHQIETPTGTQVSNISSPALTPSHRTISQTQGQHPPPSTIHQARPPPTIAPGSVKDVHPIAGHHALGDIADLVTKSDTDGLINIRLEGSVLLAVSS